MAARIYFAAVDRPGSATSAVLFFCYAILPPDSLSACFAHRIELRDNPPPPPPLSHKPAAIQARVEARLQATHPQRDYRARQRQALALLAFMEHPRRTTQELMPLVQLGERATIRLAQTLIGFGLLSTSATTASPTAPRTPCLSS